MHPALESVLIRIVFARIASPKNATCNRPLSTLLDNEIPVLIAGSVFKTGLKVIRKAGHLFSRATGRELNVRSGLIR
jgi:hypothetical protein